MKKTPLPDVYSFDQLFTYSGLEGPTDYANMLTLLSRKERFTYWPMLPCRSGLIRFPDVDSPVTVCSDFADFGKTRILLADAWNLLIEGPVEFSDISPEHYEITQKDGKTLFATKGFSHPQFLDDDFNALFDKKVNACQCLTHMTEGMDDLTAKAVARAYSVLKACIYAPEEKFPGFWATPDRWPHRQCWIMDSVYQALGVQHFNKQAACDIISALFAHQCPDGRIPMTASPLGFSRLMIQQPVIANGLKAIHAPDDVIRFALPRLVAFLEWIMMHRDLDNDGILEWVTFAPNRLCPCGESGMDNSPRFDERSIYGAVDLTCFVSRECECVAEFAARLGDTDTMKRFEAHHKRLNSLICNNFWNDELDFFTDFEIFYHKQTNVMAVSGFLPLLCGAATEDQAAKLAAHIWNPNTFGTKYPLPSVSLSDPKFELDMWRGPVWHIFNYHAAEGLDRYGFHKEARHIRTQTVESAIRYYREFGGFFEFYDPNGIVPPGRINRKGTNHPDDDSTLHRAIHDYGWSAAIFLDMLLKLQS